MARSSRVWFGEEARGWEGLTGSKDLFWTVLLELSKDRCVCGVGYRYNDFRASVSTPMVLWVGWKWVGTEKLFLALHPPGV